jgi:hypothetical protein
MVRVGVVFIWSVFMFLCGNCVFAQNFPYAVPQAPEFDERGRTFQNAPDNSPREISPPPMVPQTRQSNAPKDKMDFRNVRPYTQQEQPQYEPEMNQVPNYSQPMQQAPQQKRTRKPQEQYQNPATQQQMQSAGRPDCTQYPMLIARSQSEAEMQMTAKKYLSCLLENGWQMDQAKQHVIATIESTFKLTR